MSGPQWFLLVGAVLVAMGLTAPLIRRLPVTSAIIYLALGLLVGPTMLRLFHFNPLRESALLELLTEAAVLISLYAAGVKMPVPFSFARWRAPLLLATASMAVTVLLVAAFAHFALGLPAGAAVLLGAIVAPTDPVLATDIQVRHPGDRDRLRFDLTCEAGMNDGSAFPFVMLGLGLLGLHEIGDAGLHWLLRDVLWATAAGVAVGLACGRLMALAAAALRRSHGQHELMDDFLGLGLIGVVYGISDLLGGWGFLAVFFAAVALRQTEERQRARQLGLPADAPAVAQVSTASLVFKEHLERLSELVLVLLVGGSLFLDSWSWRALGLALFLFLVARPISVLVGLAATRTPRRRRWMAGWFGVRGIGSLYYLMYAIGQGLPREIALELVHLTLVVITLSILLHGISAKPLMARMGRLAPC